MAVNSNINARSQYRIKLGLNMEYNHFCPSYWYNLRHNWLYYEPFNRLSKQF